MKGRCIKTIPDLTGKKRRKRTDGQSAAQQHMRVKGEGREEREKHLKQRQMGRRDLWGRAQIMRVFHGTQTTVVEDRAALSSPGGQEQKPRAVQ